MSLKLHQPDFRSKLDQNMSLIPYNDSGKQLVLDTSSRPFAFRAIKPDDFISKKRGSYNHYYPEANKEKSVHCYGALSRALFDTFSYPGILYSEILEQIYTFRSNKWNFFQTNHPPPPKPS